FSTYLYEHLHHRVLLPFPTRRSSDLIPLLLANPHSLIEGMAITSFAIGSDKAFIYLRGEVAHVHRRVRHAINEAKAAGLLGENRSEEHTSELQSRFDLVCRLLLEKKK